MRQFTIPAMFTLLALTAGACATASTEAPAGGVESEANAGVGEQVAVQVENDLIPPTQVTVFAVSEASRQILGNVNPSARASFSFDLIGASRQYRMLARTTSGAEVVSNPFTITGPSTVSWSLQSGIAVVQ
jgi:hypothetical protein